MFYPLLACCQQTATGDSSKFIALGAFDSKVRLISAYSYQTAFVLPLVHPKEMDAGFNSADVQLTVEVQSGVVLCFDFRMTPRTFDCSPAIRTTSVDDADVGGNASILFLLHEVSCAHHVHALNIAVI